MLMITEVHRRLPHISPRGRLYNIPDPREDMLTMHPIMLLLPLEQSLRPQIPSRERYCRVPQRDRTLCSTHTRLTASILSRAGLSLSSMIALVVRAMRMSDHITTVRAATLMVT